MIRNEHERQPIQIHLKPHDEDSRISNLSNTISLLLKFERKGQSGPVSPWGRSRYYYVILSVTTDMAVGFSVSCVFRPSPLGGTQFVHATPIVWSEQSNQLIISIETGEPQIPTSYEPPSKLLSLQQVCWIM